HGEVTLGLLELRLVFVVFEAHDGLALLHLVALVDADPFDAADDPGGNLDFVRRYDVSGGVQDNSLGCAAGIHADDALSLDLRGGIDFARYQAPCPEREQEEHAGDDPPRGPFGGLSRTPLRAVDF